MEIIELLTHANKDIYLDILEECEWIAGKFLAKIIKNEEFIKLCGPDAFVYMLVEDEKIISFCTYAHQDDVNAPDMYPWIGFVYTYPEYRGHRYFGKLLDKIEHIAISQSYHQIYVSTNESGLYEKYGFMYYKNMLDITGNDSRIYIKRLA